jgi:hypothetical protein
MAEDSFNGRRGTGERGVQPGCSLTVVALLVFLLLWLVGYVRPRHDRGAPDEFTTLAFRHAAEDAMGGLSVSQREVETSHPDRASCANRFRPCYLLRTPDP